ncbi:MAG: HDOD domain-containing protein [Desulfobulbaceae bacterium]|uniref:HDOD domain-containing protein n=1 Tax=Candidatus Desulfobia pelagia TaxID=2841692 RepID=A0A8J6NA38_9BACT|nr:HDOD domain-containing protein [Candidatus Desulfobia pelagia]
MASAKRLISKFTEVKPLPAVAIRVTQLANSESTTIQDFEEIIKLDPVLVMRLLRLVNSPFFGLTSKVESISKAVVFVGLQQLRNLVAVEAARDFFSEANGQSEFPRKNLWVNSATVAVLAQLISRRIFGKKGDDVFLAAILHDIGLVVEDQVVPDEFHSSCSDYVSGEKPLLFVAEDEKIGTNHTKIGELMASDWKLPEDVIQAIRFHHDHDTSYPVPSVISILQLAEFMTCKLKYGVVFDKIDPLPSYLQQHLKAKMAEYKVLLKSLPEEMKKAEELFKGA